MANNYIIYPYGDQNTPKWRDTGVIVTNQAPVNVGEITTAFATDTWNNLGGNSFTPFAVNEDSTITSSTWVLAKYTYVDASTTGLANATAIHNAIAAAVAASSSSNHVKDLHSHNSYSTYENISVEFTHASYNWSSVDTSGYTYSSGFASTMSGNEDYPTDYWSKADFQTDTVNYKDQVISKISTNQNDIIEFLVKNSLTPEAIKRLHVQLSNDGIRSEEHTSELQSQD